MNDDSIGTAVKMRLRNDRGEHGRLQGALREFCATHGVPKDCAQQLRLMLEEMFTNAAKYAYAEGVPGWVDVTFDCRNGELSILVEDQGMPFNPLECPTTDLSIDFDRREIGGHGLLLIRTLADEIDYDYHEQRNRLRVKYMISGR